MIFKKLDIEMLTTYFMYTLSIAIKHKSFFRHLTVVMFKCQLDELGGIPTL